MYENRYNKQLQEAFEAGYRRGMNEDFGTGGGWGMGGGFSNTRPPDKGQEKPIYFPPFPINIPGLDDDFYHEDGTGGDWIDDTYWDGPGGGILGELYCWFCPNCTGC